MTPTDLLHLLALSVVGFAAVFLAVYWGWASVTALLSRQEQWYRRVLVEQLLIDINPRTAVLLSVLAVIVSGMIVYMLVGGPIWFFLGAGVGLFVPNVTVRHLEQKRRQRLEQQLVDGITTLASGVRAGLNLVQSMELLVRNLTGPIKQEFAQLLREYQLGLDLNHAMRNAANRIGLSNYRLLFTALEMHRLRGGDAGESLDRIAESIREIQRLEGKLDAVTAHGRTQAWMMATMPIVFVIILSLIDPEGMNSMVTEPLGRMIMLVSALMVLGAFYWIRRIMAIDI